MWPFTYCLKCHMLVHTFLPEACRGPAFTGRGKSSPHNFTSPVLPVCSSTQNQRPSPVCQVASQCLSISALHSSSISQGPVNGLQIFPTQNQSGESLSLAWPKTMNQEIYLLNHTIHESLKQILLKREKATLKIHI